MKRNIRKAYGLAGVFALGASASAQQPAAELLPVRSVEPITSIVRGATPYAPFAAIPQAPADSVPSPKFADAKPYGTEQKSWASRQWNNTVDLVVGKPDAPPHRPYAPFVSLDGKPAVAAQAAPTGPIPQRQPMANPAIQPVAAKAPVQAPQGVYAGPPAYRWYGWGSTTPGANPHSPTGVYPKASANWYSQTGATPGAFPVPVTYPRRENGAEPPAYVGGLNPGMAEPSIRTVIAELPRSSPMPPVPYPEYPVQASAPAIPSGAPTPIVVNTAPPTPPVVTHSAPVEAVLSVPASTPVAVTTPVASELNWQAAAKPIVAPALVPAPPAAVITPPAPMFIAPPAPEPMAMPIITAPPAPAKEFVPPAGPIPMAPVAPIIAPMSEKDQAWGKPKMSRESGIVQASASIAASGHHQHDAGVTLEQSIRSACPSQVRKVEINRIGGNGLVVRFVVDSEAHAQEAATAIAELPELKAFDVRYEAMLLAK